MNSSVVWHWGQRTGQLPHFCFFVGKVDWGILMVWTVCSRGVAKEGKFSVCKVQSFLPPSFCPTPDYSPYSHTPTHNVITHIIQNLYCFLLPVWSLKIVRSELQFSISGVFLPSPLMFLGVFTSYTWLWFVALHLMTVWHSCLCSAFCLICGCIWSWYLTRAFLLILYPGVFLSVVTSLCKYLPWTAFSLILFYSVGKGGLLSWVCFIPIVKH